MLQFVREVSIPILIQKASLEQRGFLFHISAGFSGDINPLTGMSANLVHIDHWLTDLKQKLRSQIFYSESDNLNEAFATIISLIQSELSQRTHRDQVVLNSLVCREERGLSLVWDKSMPDAQIEILYLHFLEAFPQRFAEFELLKIEFCWRRPSSCHLDLQHEGFKILKSIQDTNLQKMSELRQVLRQSLKYQLPSGSLIQGISIYCLVAGYKVDL